MQGKAGHAPAAEELVVALKSHDLFVYFGDEAVCFGKLINS